MAWADGPTNLPSGYSQPPLEHKAPHRLPPARNLPGAVGFRQDAGVGGAADGDGGFDAVVGLRGAQRAASNRLISTSSGMASPVKARGDQRLRKIGSMS